MSLHDRCSAELLVPEENQRFGLIEGLQAVLGPSYLLVVAEKQPWVTLSSGIIGGGLGAKRYFINRQVLSGYCAERPVEELATYLAASFKEYDLSGRSDWTALMTAAQVKDACFIRLTGPDCRAAVIVTAGVDNACAAGVTPYLSLDPAVTGPPGTINIMAFSSQALTHGAMVNAVQTVTEAKTQILREFSVRCPLTGAYASGTNTDAVVIAAPDAPVRLPYAGPGTMIGYLFASGVRRAVSEALKRYLSKLG